ncbi:hypothetical protein CYMTET_24247 [Cymbomonas tetramitiformis]|uniref:Uncharacterized protein n=1 Tax=Cymbomonas tetramitiformis TaxID=36881 RepID=A0AAE0L032_9CHLO|nr:hypothetical protein CYMTET_24247 [Cymbomonas tetramitiformis]
MGCDIPYKLNAETKQIEFGEPLDVDQASTPKLTFAKQAGEAGYRLKCSHHALRMIYFDGAESGHEKGKNACVSNGDYFYLTWHDEEKHSVAYRIGYKYMHTHLVDDPLGVGDPILPYGHGKPTESAQEAMANMRNQTAVADFLEIDDDSDPEEEVKKVSKDKPSAQGASENVVVKVKTEK